MASSSGGGAVAVSGNKQAQFEDLKKKKLSELEAKRNVRLRMRVLEFVPVRLC